MPSVGRVIQVGAIVVCLVLVASACDWSQLYGGSADTNDAVGEPSPTAADVGSLAVQWSYALGTVDYGGVSEPVTLGNDVYVATSHYPDGGALDDFQVAGGPCGSGATCTPRWSAHASGSIGFGQLTLAGGRVYAGGATLQVYDAAGQTSCSGSPTVCQPLWSSADPAADPVAVGSTLYVDDGSEVSVYPTDTSGCSGTPLVCTPTRRYSVAGDAEPLGGAGVDGPVAIVGHDMYVPVETGDDVGTDGEVDHFDLSSSAGCTASPVVCTTTTWMATGVPDRVTADGQHVYVAGSVSSNYPPPDGFPPDSWLKSFQPDGTPVWSDEAAAIAGLALDANHLWGTSNTALRGYPLAGCSSTCAPTVTGPLSASPTAGPVESNGLIYVGTGSTISVFSATGGPSCTGSPLVCQPLATLSVNGETVTDIVPSNSRLLVVTKTTTYPNTAHLVVMATTS